MIPPVPSVELAPGLRISRILIGLWQVADQERGGAPLDPERAADALEPWVDAGFTTVDVADHYGSAEIIAGRLRRRRPAVRVLTKWVADPGTVSRDAVRAAVGRSLDRIGADRIDLLQFHAWRYEDPAWLDALEHLVELREQGWIGNLGVTNFDAGHLDLALRTGFPLVSNQVSFSLFDRRAAGPLTRVCRTHGVRLLAYGTLAGGLLSDRWFGAPDPGLDGALTWSQLKYRRFIRSAGGWGAFQRLLRAARRIARRTGASVANVASRFVLDQPAVAGVIVGVRPGAPSHLADNRRLAGLTLDRGSLAELTDAGFELDPIPGDCGDEYRRPPYLTATGDLSQHISGFPPPCAVETTADGVAAMFDGKPVAVRSGDRIRCLPRPPTHKGHPIGGGEPGAEAQFQLDRIEGALTSLGASLRDLTVLRLRIRREQDRDPLTRACLTRFPGVPPDITLAPDTDASFGCAAFEAEARTGRPIP